MVELEEDKQESEELQIMDEQFVSVEISNLNTLSTQKVEESEEDMKFPDEVQTPTDTPARIRFQKYLLIHYAAYNHARYRGLKSFRSSPWDAKENLPAAYAKIFQFENFNRTKKRALADLPEAIQAGQYITLHIANVPVSALSKIFRLGLL